MENNSINIKCYIYIFKLYRSITTKLNVTINDMQHHTDQVNMHTNVGPQRRSIHINPHKIHFPHKIHL